MAMKLSSSLRIKFVVLILGTVLAVAGCSSSESGSAATQSLTIAYEADSSSLDPGQVTDINTMNVLVQMYDTLVKWDADANLVPSLATEWEISPDGLTYTFTLRDDVKFSDGTPLTAKDVAYSFNRMLVDKAPGSEYGPYPFGKFFYGAVANVEAKDDVTAVFNLSTPNGGLLSALTTPTAQIVNTAAAESAGKEFALVGGGSGPFMLETWQKGTQLVLKQNPNYWGSKPTLTQLVWVPVTEASQRVTNLSSGSAGLIINPQPASIPKLSSDGFNVLAETGPHIWWVGLNLELEQFQNIKVRQAMNYAIDRDSMVSSILFGSGAPANQPIGEGLPGRAPSADSYNYDPEKAKRLMSEAGYPNGFEVNFFVPTSGSGMQEPVAMGTAIQSYLAAIGIKVKIEQLDWGTFLGKLGPGATKSGMDMWELSWMNTSLDPSLVLGPLLTTGSFPPGFNTGFYSNKQVDKLVADAAAEKDPAARIALFEKASALVNADAPWLFINNGKAVYAAAAGVKGLILNKGMPFLLTELKDASIG